MFRLVISTSPRSTLFPYTTLFRSCGWSEEGCRLVVRWRLTNSSRLLDGTCEQFFCRFLFSAAADFQKREYAEHQDRSEEHTSELQSRQYLVCRLLLEKKKYKYEVI